MKPITDDGQVELELRLSQIKEVIKKGDALERLSKNKDFKFLILDGYLKEEAARLVKLRADNSSTFNEVIKKSIDSKITGVGEFNEFLRMIKKNSDSGIDELVKYEEYLAMKDMEGVIIEDEDENENEKI